METKDYTVQFYVGQVGADGAAGQVSKLLRAIAQRKQPATYRHKGMTYEIRDLKPHGEGASSFTGVLAKFRTDDFPHIAAPGRQEREIVVGDDEGLIEKNHFLYFRKREMLVWQCNQQASTVAKLGDVLSEEANETVVFQPIFQPDAVRRLMRGEVVPRSLELSIAKPTNADFYPKNEWSRQLFSMMQLSGGARFKLVLTSDQRSRDPEQKSLAGRIKSAVRELVAKEMVTVARFQVEDDGVVHPLDLIEDRISTRQSVEMDGRYPAQGAMYAALRRARDEQQGALNDFFGTENSLD